MLVNRTLFATLRSVIAVRHVVQHDICYVRNVIVIRHLFQHEVIATELYTRAL